MHSFIQLTRIVVLTLVVVSLPTLQCFALVKPTAKIRSTAPKIGVFNDYLLNSLNSNENSVILIDGDNVRGKTKFQLSKEDLYSQVELWKSTYQINASIILFLIMHQNIPHFIIITVVLV